MKYQSRYQAYLDAGGQHNPGRHHYFISFIGEMKRQYLQFIGQAGHDQIHDHDKFTAFIQQWVALSNSLFPMMMGSPPGIYKSVYPDISVQPPVYEKITKPGWAC